MRACPFEMKFGTVPTFLFISLRVNGTCNVLRASKMLLQRATIGRMHEKKSGPLRKKRVNKSAPVPNEAYDGPNIYLIRTYKFDLQTGICCMERYPFLSDPFPPFISVNRPVQRRFVSTILMHSALAVHLREYHPTQVGHEKAFKLKVLKTFKKLMERQVAEAVLINNSKADIMNR